MKNLNDGTTYIDYTITDETADGAKLFGVPGNEMRWAHVCDKYLPMRGHKLPPYMPESIRHDIFVTLYTVGSDTRIPVHFCPICGKKLDD